MGDIIPEAMLCMKGDEGIKSLTTDDMFKGKKVAIFGVPGAFTPT